MGQYCWFGLRCQVFKCVGYLCVVCVGAFVETCLLVVLQFKMMRGCVLYIIFAITYFLRVLCESPL